MIVKVHEHKVEIIKTPVNEQEVNVTKCTFEFDETIPNNYVKKAFFTLNGNAYEQTIVNNECDIPNEVLSKKGSIELGVVAYKVENEELIQRFNPSPDYFDSWTGSLKEAENTEPITPTDKEQIESAIAQLENDVEELDNTKQDTLVSGENIKTINNESLLGNGNINLNDTYYTKSETYNKTEIGNIKSEIENEIPTKISELDNDLNFIDKSVDNLDNYTKTSDLPDFSTFSLITETGSKIDLEINSSTYVLTAKLYDKNNTLISTSSSIDLPLETMVVGASYDSYTKEIILTLKNGQEVRFSVADLVSGLQPEITPSNKLASDLVDDTNQNNKFISQSEKAQITTNATNIAGIKNGTTINNFAGVESALNGKEDKSNKVNSIDSTSTDTQYPSAKCMYDSQVSQDNEISDLQSENDYINSIINQLPKVSSQGTILTLNNTIKGRMNIELGTSELEQETTTGKNLFNNIYGRVVSVYTIPVSATGPLGNLNCYEVQLEANTTYTLTINMNGFAVSSAWLAGICYTNGTYISLLQYGTMSDITTNTFTTDSTGKIYVGQRYGFSENNRMKLFLETAQVQIEKGSTSTTFEKFTYGASPNPQYPQTIHTISGNNKVVVCNKNLMNLGTQLNGYVDASTLKFQVNDSSIGYYFKTSMLPNTITLSSVNGNRANVCYFNDIPAYNVSCLLRSASNDNPRTITIDKTYTYVHIQFSYNYVDVAQIQVESGSTKTDFVTSTSQEANINLGDIEYCEIGDYKDEFVRSDGSNLFDENNTSDYFINTSTGATQSSTKWTQSTYIKVLPNTTYTVSSTTNPLGNSVIEYNEYNNSKTWIQGIQTGSTTANYVTFTTGSTTEYLILGHRNDLIENVMLNIGSAVLPYQPYGIGNWGIRKAIGKVVLDGSESWSYENGRFLLNFLISAPNVAGRQQIYSNYYEYIGSGTADYGAFVYYASASNTQIYVYNKDYTTASDFENWLSTHNTTMYYPLATPTYTKITGTLAEQLENIYQYLLSYKGQTNIYQINNDLPFNISASALLDLNTLVGE